VTELSLLIDQGNTRLKWVYASEGQIDEESLGVGSIDDFMQAVGQDRAIEPDRVLLSSVADPGHAMQLSEFCKRHWDLSTQLMKSTKSLGGVRNAYHDPTLLGVDRWLAIVGAATHYGKPVVIWDIGTATTLDAVDETGQHLGGFILPGPETMFGALSRDTKLNVPGSPAPRGLAPGDSTEKCIRNGVFATQVGALNQFLRSVTPDIGSDSTLVVTGGGARELLFSLDFTYIHDPWLVFRGMLVN
jgi:type III pantothenate kinase